MYEYRCQVYNVVDGDTVDCAIDLGLKTTRTERIRLWGINVRDKKEPNALTATAFMRFLVLGKTLTIRTIKDKDDKYGRLLGVLYEKGASDSVNQKMLDQGYAQVFMANLTAAGRLPEVLDGEALKD